MHRKELELFSQAIAAVYDMAADPRQRSALKALAPTSFDTLLQPHLERAQQLGDYVSRLQLEQVLQETTLDAISVGAIIADASARPLYTTRIAGQLLKAGHGLMLREGKLEAAARTSTQKLRQQIERVAMSAQSGVASVQQYLSFPLADGAALQLHITALPEPARALGFGEACALIYCYDVRRERRPLTEIFEHLFHLTPAESQVAEALLRGTSLKNYAEQRQLSIHTVKNQLKSIFEKTRHTSQVDFVHDVLSNPLITVATLFTRTTPFMAK
jgi:DNA-binding CsgD family transcriptional regulator